AAERPRHHGRDRRGPPRDRPLRRGAGAALEHRRPPRPVLPGVQQLPVHPHRPGGAAGRPHDARRARRRRALRAAPGGVRPRLHARGHQPARRPGRAAGGQELAGPPRAAHPLHGRLRRPRLLRPHHAGAVERGEPADHVVAGHEDRPAVHVPADQPVGAPLRLGGLRLPLPGPARPDAVPVLPQLHPRADPRSVVL
ncbi:MAG: Deoxycytidine triphosphate deaminase (dUMP-forming), partial [uncultured Blastococcus sp.]